MLKNIFKFLFFIFTILLFLLFFSKNYILEMNPNYNYTFENTNASINELYIYGNHLNLKGTLDIDFDITELNLILFGNKEMNYKLNFENIENGINFYISDKKNNGILLDNLEKNSYIVFLKVTDINGNNTYYKLKNNTNYPETEYYTIRKNNNINYILIKEDRENTLNINVMNKKDNLDDIYDVVIDAGHGGIDPGACFNGLCETDFTLTLSKKLKEKLESHGLKVKLTRDDSTPTDVKFETYGKDGRIDRAMTSRAKYLFSFHLNSGLYTRTGVEIYTTNNIDYTLAKNLADNIVNNTNTTYSNNPIFKVGEGIYTRTFQNYEIRDVINEANKEGYEPYDITTNTTYYYIIRETGGFMTGAYTDGREPDKNLHVNTNVGLESYIMEVGYITNPNDTNDIKTNMDKYIDAIGNAIIDNICE